MKPSAKSNIDIVQKKVKPTAKINNSTFQKKGTDKQFTDSSGEDENNSLPDDGNAMKLTSKSNIEIVQKKVEPTAKSNNPINHKKGKD